MVMTGTKVSFASLIFAALIESGAAITEECFRLANSKGYVKSHKLLHEFDYRGRLQCVFERTLNASGSKDRVTVDPVTQATDELRPADFCTETAQLLQAQLGGKPEFFDSIPEFVGCSKALNGCSSLYMTRDALHGTWQICSGHSPACKNAANIRPVPCTREAYDAIIEDVAADRHRTSARGAGYVSSGRFYSEAPPRVTRGGHSSHDAHRSKHHKRSHSSKHRHSRHADSDEDSSSSTSSGSDSESSTTSSSSSSSGVDEPDVPAAYEGVYKGHTGVFIPNYKAEVDKKSKKLSVRPSSSGKVIFARDVAGVQATASDIRLNQKYMPEDGKIEQVADRDVVSAFERIAFRRAKALGHTKEDEKRFEEAFKSNMANQKKLAVHMRSLVDNKNLDSKEKSSFKTNKYSLGKIRRNALDSEKKLREAKFDLEAMRKDIQKIYQAEIAKDLVAIKNVSGIKEFKEKAKQLKPKKALLERSDSVKPDYSFMEGSYGSDKYRGLQFEAFTFMDLFMNDLNNERSYGFEKVALDLEAIKKDDVTVSFSKTNRLYCYSLPGAALVDNAIVAADSVEDTLEVFGKEVTIDDELFVLVNTGDKIKLSTILDRIGGFIEDQLYTAATEEDFQFICKNFPTLKRLVAKALHIKDSKFNNQEAFRTAMAKHYRSG